MTNPPSWRPQDEPLGLGVVSDGRTITRPPSARVIAGLAIATLAAVGIAAYAATDFLDVDPIETASVANGPAVAPKPAPKKAVSVDRSATAATARPVKSPPASAATAGPSISESAHPAAEIERSAGLTDSVRKDLRNPAEPKQIASSVFLPPASADHIGPLAPDVVVAESEADVARLESQIGMGEPMPESDVEIARLERAAAPSQAAASMEEVDTAAMGGPYIPVPEMKATRVTRYVNLRNGPADEAKVIAVIPTDATVQAETNCGWCAVTYNGQSGYIYKGFLSGRGGGGVKAVGGRTRTAKKLTGKPGLY